VFEFINNIKKISNNINSFTSIYSDVDIGAGDVKFSKEYKIFIERAGREITGMKNSARPQSLNKRRKLTRS
jgi:hypothetical protein